MPENKLLISVVVPIYKVENYIHQCVDSILTQTYENIEVVLVDDGSPDNCPAICDEYAQKDSRVKVVHKQNGGPSSARNAGIKASIGDYLMFVDSDDYWDSDTALASIVKIIDEKKPDIVCFGYKEYFDNNATYGKGIYEDVLLACKNDENFCVQKMIENGVFVSSSWVKTVKSELIKDNDIFFVEGITNEDVDWTARLLLNAFDFEIYEKSFYIYRQREGSIVHSIKYENLEMMSENIKKCLSYISGYVGKDLLNNYYNYVAYQYICFLKVSILCENDKRTAKLLKAMKEYRWLLKYRLNKKVKIVYWFNKLLGYRLMQKALKIYSKVK